MAVPFYASFLKKLTSHFVQHGLPSDLSFSKKQTALTSLQKPPICFLRHYTAHPDKKKYWGEYIMLFSKGLLSYYLYTPLHQTLWKHGNKHWNHTSLSTASTPTSSNSSVALPSQRGWYALNFLVDGFYRPVQSRCYHRTPMVSYFWSMPLGSYSLEQW